jgi:dTDP-4-dehydrorhamnose 3,5-epimerase
MEVVDLSIPEVKLIRPRVFRDSRGFFIETYHMPRYSQAGITMPFVQDNYSRSTQGTLRGLHYQSSPGQAKLVRASKGRIWDVVVDIRPNSPTFGKWDAAYLDADDHVQIFVPVGCAHGFCVMSDFADVVYKVSAPYDAATECAIRFDDPELAVPWPIANPLVSDRDRNAESFTAYRARVGQ